MATTGVKTADARRPRTIATFEEYYWEAYNEIVHPSRFDWYLVTRWLPELGPEGFAIVKVLRSRCYFNPREGTLRNTCEIAMDDLATMVGMKRSTLYREFERNEALKRFVQQQHQYAFGEKRPHRCDPQFLVCMDDPVHPEDMPRYEALRLQKEQEREWAAQKPGRKFTLKPKSQNGINDLPQSQNGIPQSQIETPQSQNGICPNKVSSLPSEIFTKDLFTDPAGPEAPSHKCVPPEGEGEGVPDALEAAWQKALAQLAAQVNKPTYETHLRTLQPDALSESGEVTLLVPSPFTRDWLEKRCGALIAAALSSALGREVAVRLVLHGTDRSAAK